MLNRFLAGAAALAVIAGSTIVFAQNPGPQNMGQSPAAGMPPGQVPDGPDDDIDVLDSQSDADDGGYELQSAQAPQFVQYDPAQGPGPYSGPSGPSYGPPSYGPPSYGPPSYGPPSYGPSPSYGPPPSYGAPPYQMGQHQGPHHGGPQDGPYGSPQYGPQYGYQGPPPGPQYGYQQPPPSHPYGADQAGAPQSGDYALASAPSTEELNTFIEGRIASLRTALKLTQAQQQNWAAFETAVRDLAKLQAERVAHGNQQQSSAASPSTSAPSTGAAQPSGAARAPSANAAPSTSAAAPSQAPDLTEMITDLRQAADAMMRDAAAFKKLADATEPLYKSLDDTQKRSFAELSEPLLPLGAMN